MAKVLNGIRVLDLGRVLVGPITGMLLADLGAEVVKSNPPTAISSALRTRFQRRKHEQAQRVPRPRSALGREALLRLVEDADVLLENFRPGVMARLGLEVQTLHARNPRLIVCSISGFAPTAPTGRDPPTTPVPWL